MARELLCEEACWGCIFLHYLQEAVGVGSQGGEEEGVGLGGGVVGAEGCGGEEVGEEGEGEGGYGYGG